MSELSTARLRVTLVITELEVGGAERCLVNVARGLDRDRFEPRVVSLASRPEAVRGELVCSLDEAGIPVTFLDCNHPWQAGHAVSRLTRCLRQQRPHIVQSFLFHANVISYLAGLWVPDAAVSLGIRVADPSRLRMLVERSVARRSARVVCVSQSTANHFAGSDPQRHNRITVISNGVDVPRLTEQVPADLTPLGVAPEQRVICCIARLAPQKGIDRLLSVAPQLLTRLPQHVLLLVGEGPSDKHLRQQAAHSPVGDRILFAGWRPDVPQILQASELMILPSRWEGMPNVLLEAMACGLPVVCTAAAGVMEVLGPLSEAQTTANQSPQDLVNKAVTILHQPHFAARLGSENRQRVSSHFALTTTINAYQQLFEQLAADRR